MGGERLSPPIYKVSYTPEGAQLTTVTRRIGPKLQLRSLDPTQTSDHEALHTVVAQANGTDVEHVSIVPGPGYLGITKPTRFDAAAAAAAHAFGGTGTTHDRFIIQAHGHSVGAASSAAVDIISKDNNEKKVVAVAMALEMHGSLDNHGIKQVMQEVDEDERVVNSNMAIVDIFVKKPTGETYESRGVKVKGNSDPIDLIPGKEATVAKRSNLI